MAAISSSSLAATAQTGNPTTPVPSPFGGSDFASFLIGAAEGESPDTSDSSTAAGAVLVAGSLITPQTAQPLTADLTATLPTPVATTELLPTASGTPVPATEVAQAASRSEQLRLTTAPAARTAATTASATTQAEATPPLSAPTEPTTERPSALPTGRVPVGLTVPAPPATTPLAATTAAVTATERASVVVPQVPVIAEKSQQLPALPPEIGYSLVRPELTGPASVQQVAAVGVGVSQGQIEATIHQLQTRAETREAPAPTTATNTGVAFRTELTAQTSPPAEATTTTAVPTSEAAPTVPQPTMLANTERPTTEPRPGFVISEPLTPQGTTPQGAAVPTAGTFIRDVGVGETSEPALDASRLVQTDAVLPTTTPTVGTEATPSAPRVNANSPPVAAQLSEAFVVQAQMLSKDGRHEFLLRLDPPELGEVQVRVLATGNRLEARLVVTDDAVKQLIESQLPELRQRLEAAGVSVPTFDVTTDSGGRASGGEDSDQPPAFAPQPKTAAPAARTPTRHTASGGLIDVTA